MRLLILTQAVDLKNPALGFLCRWVEEFAKHCESVEVICLEKGKYHFPENVRIHSLGKECGVSRLKYLFNFYRYLFSLRYDSVFVHMNPEYAILGGWWWRLTGKYLALWYTHKAVNLRLWLGALFADRILTASKESFRLASRKVRVMGHGIDTDFFSPDPGRMRGEWLLSVGRLSKVKRHDLVIRTAALARHPLRIAGEGPDRVVLNTLARELNIRVEFLGGLEQTRLRDEYRRAYALVHTSETGSLDKVVLEALACGLPVVTTSRALGGAPATVAEPTPEALAATLAHMPPADTEYVRTHHSLKALIQRILEELSHV